MAKEFYTLEEAKEYLRAHFEEGAECPCCKQFVKLYKRKLNSAMAYGLILLYKAPTEDWVHVENYFKTLDIPSSIRGDVSKLRHWDLIEQMQGEREDGSKRVGYYKITEKGKDFVRGNIRIRSRVGLYNQEVRGFDGDMITIHDALGDKFNYSELMEG